MISEHQHFPLLSYKYIINSTFNVLNISKAFLTKKKKDPTVLGCFMTKHEVTWLNNGNHW